MSPAKNKTMETSNKTITTVNGYTVVLRPFITGGDKRHIKDSFTEDIMLNGNTEQKNGVSYSMKASKANIAQDRAVTAVVFSVDGPGVDKTKSIPEQVLGLPADDSDEVMALVEEATADKKKAPNTPTTSADSTTAV